MTEKKTAIEVPAEVYEGLERVRSSGLTNMLDRPAVIRLAREAGDYEAASWVEENKTLYSRGIFAGFAAEAGAE